MQCIRASILMIFGLLGLRLLVPPPLRIFLRFARFPPWPTRRGRAPARARRLDATNRTRQMVLVVSVTNRGGHPISREAGATGSQSARTSTRRTYRHQPPSEPRARRRRTRVSTSADSHQQPPKMTCENSSEESASLQGSGKREDSRTSGLGPSKFTPTKTDSRRVTPSSRTRTRAPLSQLQGSLTALCSTAQP